MSNQEEEAEVPITEPAFHCPFDGTELRAVENRFIQAHRAVTFRGCPKCGFLAPFVTGKVQLVRTGGKMMTETASFG